jgi:hypothetical protein
VACYLARGFGKNKVSTDPHDVLLGQGQRRADIRLHTRQGHFVYLDIAIVHPACAKYATFGAATSASTPMEAARRMFVHKQGRAFDPQQARAFDEHTFFPIVFETSGNLYEQSMLFLQQRMCRFGCIFTDEQLTSNLDWMLRRCRATIAESVHTGITDFFRNSRTLAVPPQRRQQQQPQPQQQPQMMISSNSSSSSSSSSSGNIRSRLAALQHRGDTGTATTTPAAPLADSRGELLEITSDDDEEDAAGLEA